MEGAIVKEALLKIEPNAFKRLCQQRILRESAFVKVEVTGRSGDGGIDGTGVLRLNSSLSFHVLFQSKRYRGSVGAVGCSRFSRCYGRTRGQGDDTNNHRHIHCGR